MVNVVMLSVGVHPLSQSNTLPYYTEVKSTPQKGFTKSCTVTYTINIVMIINYARRDVIYDHSVIPIL
jgi:hypothetical protein